MINYITGEKFQQKCDIYIGDCGDFNYNPKISLQKEKHLNINDINNNYNNPKLIFCYSHKLYEFSLKINYFLNDFILISHNSDENITNDKSYGSVILNCKKLIKWYSQNVCFNNEKLHFLPIGLANSQWRHGDLKLFDTINILQKQSLEYKTDNVFFNFSIHTNISKRQICYDTLKDKLNWFSNTCQNNYLENLSKSKFAICPEGNGVDSHRLWECFYLEVVPIVLNSNFTQILKSHNFPIIILENWNEFDLTNLNYQKFNFDNINIIIEYNDIFNNNNKY